MMCISCMEPFKRGNCDATVLKGLLHTSVLNTKTERAMHSNIEYTGNVVHKCKNKGASHRIQKWNTSWQERIGTSKNGRIQHKKGLAYPKTGQEGTKWSPCVQK